MTAHTRPRPASSAAALTFALPVQRPYVAAAGGYGTACDLR
ncbi:hypothetical protein ACFQZ4_46195 [Catellatospora coxensis]